MSLDLILADMMFRDAAESISQQQAEYRKWRSAYEQSLQQPSTLPEQRSDWGGQTWISLNAVRRLPQRWTVYSPEEPQNPNYQNELSKALERLWGRRSTRFDAGY